MAEAGSVGIVQTQYWTFGQPPNEMELDCGQKLGPITLAYETYGTLNEDRSNAILIVHALSGDAHVAGYHRPDDRKPGWWDTMVGPGKAFDTEKHFVVCSNVLGGCRGSTGPSSTDPKTGKPYGLAFPMITIGDMVRAQKQLVDHLGITSLLTVVGGSMGGMQVLEWMTRYPDYVRSVMVIASAHLSSAQAIAFNAVGRHAILADPTFREGDYYTEDRPAKGLSIARMLAHITYLSEESMRAKFGRALRWTDQYSYDFDSEFEVETYLDYQGEQFVNRFDANSYLYITKAIDYFDLAAAYGSLDNAMARVNCDVLVLSYSSDWLYPPQESEKIVYSLTRQGKKVTYCNIASNYGHDAFLLEVDVMTEIIRGFLNNVSLPGKYCAKKPDCPCMKRTKVVRYNVPEDSIYRGRRIDYERIVELIEPESRVLDLGCGDGALLCELIRGKGVKGTGIEVDQDNIVGCAQCGIPAIHADIDRGLSGFPDQSYDYAILSMTLQVILKPEVALREMLRVARKCIISFPNFAFWKVRAKALLLGRAPVTRNLPYAWHVSPNRHVLSIKDFREFCATHNARILKEIPISSHGRTIRRTDFWPNMFADEAIFVITSESGGAS
jgi:homoserine O-acetyltransferase